MEMADEIDYDTTKPEITELQNGDTDNFTDNSVESTNMEKERERLEEQGKYFHEQGKNLDEQGKNLHERGKNLHEQGKDLEEIEFREGGSRSRGGGAFVIGSNHKFPAVRSRYLSGPIGSCHDSCKFGHRHREPEKNTTRPRPRPLWGTIRESRPLAPTGSDDMVRVLNEGAKTKRDYRRLSLPGVEKDPCVRELNISKFKRVQSEVKPSRNESQIGKKVMGRNSSFVENSTLKVKEVKPEVKKVVSRRSSLEERTAPKVKEVKPELKKIESRRSSLEESTAQKVKEVKPELSLVENTTLKVKEVKPQLKKVVSRRSSLEENTAQKVKEVKPELKKMVSRRSSFEESTALKVKEVKPDPKKEKAKEPMNGSISQPTPMKKSSSIKATIYKNVRNVSHSKKETVSNEASKPEPRIDTKSVRKVSSTTRRSQIGQNKDTKGGQTSSTNNLSSSLSTSQSTMYPKRRGSIPEDKGASSAWKVKFKRGTVVALQGSNNTPRKLKFKRCKIFNDNNDENAKNGIVYELRRGNNGTGNEQNGEKFEPSKVQLRHQEESGKKKDNVDLNNVIEETATKLVKMRKSKVKALVGAFESVMYVRGGSPMDAGVL